jgi:phenylacetate-CoA ligase
MREAYEKRGIRVTQAYATADIGSIAHETYHDGKLCDGMICNENLIVEIVRPGTDVPVPVGEVGELVVTTFNKAYPLVRFGTGDMSAVIEEPSPCGRTNMRIRGWMGRADQRTKVKGMFVDPKQIAEIVASVDGVEKARLVVDRKGSSDHMVLQALGEGISETRLREELHKTTKLNGDVELVTTLPNDGIVIEDKRDYSS